MAGDDDAAESQVRSMEVISGTTGTSLLALVCFQPVLAKPESSEIQVKKKDPEDGPKKSAAAAAPDAAPVAEVRQVNIKAVSKSYITTPARREREERGERERERSIG